jgi:hypothetical protein
VPDGQPTPPTPRPPTLGYEPVVERTGVDGRLVVAAMILVTTSLLLFGFA